MLWTKLSLRPLRFALSGGLATAAHWLIMALMINMSISPTLATAVGAFIGAVVNYILQRNVTFQSNATHRSVLLRYLGVCTLAWSANLLLFSVFHHTILLSAMYAQAITTLIVALMSYFLYKRMVFNDHLSQSID